MVYMGVYKGDTVINILAPFGFGVLVGSPGLVASKVCKRDNNKSWLMLHTPRTTCNTHTHT